MVVVLSTRGEPFKPALPFFPRHTETFLTFSHYWKHISAKVTVLRWKCTYCEVIQDIMTNSSPWKTSELLTTWAGQKIFIFPLTKKKGSSFILLSVWPGRRGPLSSCFCPEDAVETSQLEEEHFKEKCEVFTAHRETSPFESQFANSARCRPHSVGHQCMKTGTSSNTPVIHGFRDSLLGGEERDQSTTFYELKPYKTLKRSHILPISDLYFHPRAASED